MVKLKKGTKRQELARKYNIQRMVSAHKKKLRRMAKKGFKGMKIYVVYKILAPTKSKIPEIPNCIFKKDILANLKRTKEIIDRKKELQKINQKKLQE
ncbi:uncharacterized protein TA17255 [Theileria annulata]|uniref:Guanine nucleotide-binding protein-like 3 N-terminal domain-containing protein n=1 Tax=Theileria annulata TaxID=5874 RepID=Q4UAP6_THEAN|nr:uncharacterized protein TA17255 [Theileria annulata]CAI76105.1 hypothetical protein TA17255 [Theileria annulata]|eukprot:XP_952731.1 hypothetical protein TA17255 [Theileria annulata]